MRSSSLFLFDTHFSLTISRHKPEQQEKDVSKIRDTLGDIKKDEKERKKRIGSLQKETDRLQGIVDRRPEPVDEGGLAAEIVGFVYFFSSPQS